MGESLLKREFSKSDVQRARNLVRGRFTDKTRNQVGYEGVRREHHKEGDVWEEGGKTWTIKNGLKQSVGKLDKIREYVNVPTTCPVCGGPMNTRLDERFYRTHNTCYTCVVKFEDSLKLAGLWEEYEKAALSKNIQSFVEEIKRRIEAMKEDRKVQVVTDEGSVEDWGKVSNTLVEGLEEWARMLESKI